MQNFVVSRADQITYGTQHLLQIQAYFLSEDDLFFCWGVRYLEAAAEKNSQLVSHSNC